MWCNMNAKPFIPWCGGKRRLVDRIAPVIRRVKIDRYREPFFGAGALWFMNLSVDSPLAILSDLNADISNALIVIRDKPIEFMDQLSTLRSRYLSIDDDARDVLFRMLRSMSVDSLLDVDAAARFVFLMKTCSAGIYTTKRDGTMTSSHAKFLMRGRTNLNMFDRKNILACSTSLQRAVIMEASWLETLDKYPPQVGDVFYFDPPYDSEKPRPTNSLLYGIDFTQEDRVKLSASLDVVDASGAKFVLSDADTQFTRSLYSKWNVTRFAGTPYITTGLNANPDQHDGQPELLVTNHG